MDVLYTNPEITIVGALGVILIVIGFICIFKGLLRYSHKSVIIGTCLSLSEAFLSAMGLLLRRTLR